MGLMGKTLNESEGLLIKPCNSIHCFFMKIPIDVVFLDKDSEVVHRIDGMKPWSISPIIKNATVVIEANAGALKEIKIGSVTVNRGIGESVFDLVNQRIRLIK